MPAPRGSRGGARGARGGSRGGRGGAATAAAAASQPAPESSGGGGGGADGDGNAAATVTLIDSTPESSAANTPIPSRPSTPSLAAPGGSGSSTPATTRGGAGGAGGLSRFRPKNVRRDADERKKLDEQRSRDLAAKIKVEERELAKEERRARRGGRGRGDAMSQRGMMRRGGGGGGGGASGPFSAMPQENMKGGSGTAYGWSSGPSGRSGAGGGRGGGFGAGGRGGSGFNRAELTDEQRYRPRREHEPRVNVEVLSGFAEDDEGQPMFYEPRSNGAHPVGLFRTEHEDEIVKVATTAELEAEEQESDDDGDLFVPGKVPDGLGGSGGGMAGDDDNEVWHAAPTGASGSAAVKPEPGTEGESMDIDLADIPEAQVKAPPSPELTKKVPTAVMVDPSKEKKREKALQDPEVQHQMYDMQTLIQELSYYDPNIGNAGAEGADGEEAETRQDNGQDKEGRLYLFQLPPVLPPLVKPNEDGSISSAPIDLERNTGTSTTPSSAGTGAAKIKSEDSDLNNPDDEAATSEQLFPPEGGYIGKLIVRKSGKVSLDWGGTRLDLGMATETDFLTSSVMLETKDHPDQADMVTGHAAGMGQVMGKFVLTPVWDEEEDWNPSLEGIDMGDGGGQDAENADQ
ncbi:RNA polymerase III RPC4-domain-containing protein [Microdochium bolleyi]|uniref:RNA polymerase III RPC4-domain-containing protein n=1 Tax=Microdochium bolleyi TaxID=196109 RepID=A0A136J7G5_9PEZI|nr:RNA polymerase III RPC4-domain-containing protein [Microdochium bolleyi]